MQEQYVILNWTQCSSLMSGAVTRFVSVAVHLAAFIYDFKHLAVLLYILSTRVGKICAHTF
jgi:hypothetical protein